jgi:hypothetical protein
MNFDVLVIKFYAVLFFIINCFLIGFYVDKVARNIRCVLRELIKSSANVL